MLGYARSDHAAHQELDSLHFFAITAVFLVHSRPVLTHRFDITSFRWTGVDFFAIPGFLITGILIELRHQQHAFRNFVGGECYESFLPIILP